MENKRVEIFKDIKTNLEMSVHSNILKRLLNVVIELIKLV